jgi:nucleoside-diphosphate-sugar epimerase
MKRYLVTGAGGFIGRHLAAYLRANEPASEVIAPGREHDLTDAAACGRLFAGAGAVDYVFHLADVSGNARWASENAATQFFANARMALNVLESVAAHQRGARLVGFSSLWAYPASIRLARESDYWSGPLPEAIQHYGVGKKFLGSGLRACKQQLGLKGTMLVLGSVYGPGDRSDHVIPSLIQRMRANPARLEVWGSGAQMRDFIYVDDQVKAIHLHKDYDGDLLNISGGNPRSIREVVQTLVRLLPYTGEVVYRAADVAAEEDRRMDMGLAQKITGWPGNHRLRTLEEGLALTLRDMS